MDMHDLLKTISTLSEAKKSDDEDKKEPTHKGGTKTTHEKGVKHRGKYGTEFQGDDDDEEDGDKKAKKATKAADAPKRGRGRPKKNADASGNVPKYSNAASLQSFMVGNLPKGKGGKTELPGKASKKHTLKDWIEAVDNSMLAEEAASTQTSTSTSTQKPYAVQNRGNKVDVVDTAKGVTVQSFPSGSTVAAQGVANAFNKQAGQVASTTTAQGNTQQTGQQTGQQAMSEESMDEGADKKWIKGAIKKPGAFTKKAKAAGKSTGEFASHVLSHKKDYPAKTEKQAVLAKTLKKLGGKKKESVEEAQPESFDSTMSPLSRGGRIEETDKPAKKKSSSKSAGSWKNTFHESVDGVAEGTPSRGLDHAYEIYGNDHGYYVFRKSPPSRVLNIGVTEPDLTHLTNWDPKNKGVQDFMKKNMKPVNFSSLSPEHQALIREKLPLQKVAQRPQSSVVTPTQAAVTAKKELDRSLDTTSDILDPTTQQLYQTYKNQMKKAKGVAEGSERKDMTGQTCEKCKKDKYKERSQHDDMEGKVTCSCGHRVNRWKNYKEQGVAEGTEETSDWLYTHTDGSKYRVTNKGGNYFATVVASNKKYNIPFVDIGGRALGYSFGSVEDAVDQIYNSIMNRPSNMRVRAPKEFLQKGYVKSEDKKVKSSKTPVAEAGDSCRAAYHEGKHHAFENGHYRCRYDEGMAERDHYHRGFIEGLEEAYNGGSKLDEVSVNDVIVRSPFDTKGVRTPRGPLVSTHNKHVFDPDTVNTPGRSGYSTAERLRVLEPLHRQMNDPTTKDLEEDDFLAELDAEMEEGYDASLDEVSRGEWIKQQDTKAERSGKHSFKAFGQTFSTKEVDEGMNDFDIQMESWNKQLKTLLAEGVTVTTSTGQHGAPDSVSISATDEDAHRLMELLANAGMTPGAGMRSHPEGSDYRPEVSTNQSFSKNVDPMDCEVVEPYDYDEVSSALDSGGSAMNAIRTKLLALEGKQSGSMEMPDGKGFSVQSEEDEPHDTPEAVEPVDFEQVQGALEAGGSKVSHDKPAKGKKSGTKDLEESAMPMPAGNGFSVQSKEQTMPDGPTEADVTDYEAVQSDLEKKDAHQQDEFERAFSKLKAMIHAQIGSDTKSAPKSKDHAEEDHAEEDQRTVKESSERCDECGAMYEGSADDHTCESESEKLDEWANTRGAVKDEGELGVETFTTPDEYMINTITGGLNGKKIQTPHGYRNADNPLAMRENTDSLDEWRKLSGLK